MKAYEHKRGNWYFWIPAKMSATGKRRCVYKPTKTAAYNEILRLKHEWREHGKSAISDEERGYISMARTELGGDLSRLPDVLRHWRLTGPDSIIKTMLRDAKARYLEQRRQTTQIAGQAENPAGVAGD